MRLFGNVCVSMCVRACTCIYASVCICMCVFVCVFICAVVYVFVCVGRWLRGCWFLFIRDVTTRFILSAIIYELFIKINTVAFFGIRLLNTNIDVQVSRL